MAYLNLRFKNKLKVKNLKVKFNFEIKKSQKRIEKTHIKMNKTPTLSLKKA